MQILAFLISLILFAKKGASFRSTFRKGAKGDPIKYTQNYKETTVPSSHLAEAIIGLMQGDLSAERISLTSNTRLRFDQTIDGHTDYLQWMAHSFEPFVGAPVRATDRKADKRTGKVYNSLQFKTLAFPCFNIYRELFYNPLSVTGDKILAPALADRFTAVSLAFWIMDDGYWHSANSTVVLCTDSFSLKEVQFLCDMLSSRLGIQASPNIRTEGVYRIRISSTSLGLLRKQVTPHMHPSMLFKLDGAPPSVGGPGSG